MAAPSSRTPAPERAEVFLIYGLLSARDGEETVNLLVSAKNLVDIFHLRIYNTLAAPGGSGYIFWKEGITG